MVKILLKLIYSFLFKYKYSRIFLMTVIELYKSFIAKAHYFFRKEQNNYCDFEMKNDSINFNQKGYTFIDLKNLVNERINLDELPDSNVLSSHWDEVDSVDTTIRGRSCAENLYLQGYLLPDNIIIKYNPVFKFILDYLGNMKKMSFDLKFITTYRFYPTKFKDFQSYMWHMDFVKWGNDDYKFMLFLDDVNEDNGPMLISDIKLNRNWKDTGGYRFSDNYVRKTSKIIIKCEGAAYSGYFFDTKMIHKGGRVKNGVRDVIVLSFNPGKGVIENAIQIIGEEGSHKLIPNYSFLK
jgi:hypothetical protein